MNKVMLGSLIAALVALPNVGDAEESSPGGSIILAEGFALPNTYPVSDIPADINGFSFTDWCNDVPQGQPTCIPTVELELVDAKKGTVLGSVYAWGKEFSGSADGVSLVFKEFLLIDLKGGQIFTLSVDGGHPGGAFADPTVIVPKEGDQVLCGGAEGTVLGGTGVYANASGGTSIRLKVELDFATGLFVYYDELFLRFRDVFIRPAPEE
jgi:hypothetical protein